MFLWGVYCACSCNSSACLEWRMALAFSAVGNQYLGWVNFFPTSGVTTGAEKQPLTRVSFLVVDFALLIYT